MFSDTILCFFPPDQCYHVDATLQQYQTLSEDYRRDPRKILQWSQRQNYRILKENALFSSTLKLNLTNGNDRIMELQERWWV